MAVRVNGFYVYWVYTRERRAVLGNTRSKIMYMMSLGSLGVCVYFLS